MGNFSGTRVIGCVSAAVVSVAMILSGQASAAQPSGRQAISSACIAKETKNLNGYQPVAAPAYLGYAVQLPNATIYLTHVKEDASGDISGTAEIIDIGPSVTGPFTGTISSGTVQVTATFATPNAVNISSASFTGTTTCLLSQITTDSLTTTPPGQLPTDWLLYSGTENGFCEGTGFSSGQEIACIAKQIRDGIQQHRPPYMDAIPGHGAILYVSSGGHGTTPGPGSSTGGLDCSGFTRWVYDEAYQQDILGSGVASTQIKHLTIDTTSGAKIGDIVYWPPATGDAHGHVGIVIGKNYMLDEPNGKDGSPPHNLRVDRISSFNTEVPHSYYYLPGS